jgi:plasmid stabilization system protein ParE
MYSVAFGQKAAEDLDALLDYVAARSGARQADRMRISILKSAQSLERFPQRGAPVEPGENPIRLIVTPMQTSLLYRIFESDNQVIVLVVAHKGRDSYALLGGRT